MDKQLCYVLNGKHLKLPAYSETVKMYRRDGERAGLWLWSVNCKVIGA